MVFSQTDNMELDWAYIEEITPSRYDTRTWKSCVEWREKDSLQPERQHLKYDSSHVIKKIIKRMQKMKEAKTETKITKTDIVEEFRHALGFDNFVVTLAFMNGTKTVRQDIKCAEDFKTRSIKEAALEMFRDHDIIDTTIHQVVKVESNRAPIYYHADVNLNDLTFANCTLWINSQPPPPSKCISCVLL